MSETIWIQNNTAATVIDIKQDEDQPIWACRFHPTEWFHEVGCPHMEWTKEQLQEALVVQKKAVEMLHNKLAEVGK